MVGFGELDSRNPSPTAEGLGQGFQCPQLREQTPGDLLSDQIKSPLENVSDFASLGRTNSCCFTDTECRPPWCFHILSQLTGIALS